MGGYSRGWIANAGVGHVFESKDGGTTFTDISGNLPDAPANDLVITKSGKLVVASDVGVFDTPESKPGSWARVGSGLPNAIVDDLTLSSSGRTVIAATHGRGLWSFPTP
jgi:sugar lactone lactonase YvrE